MAEKGKTYIRRSKEHITVGKFKLVFKPKIE